MPAWGNNKFFMLMTFETYLKLIADSVAECGYDCFMPSLRIPSETSELQVLEVRPQPNGDKEAALEWASEFPGPERVLFCAYRNGDRQVEVVEVTGTDVTLNKGTEVVFEPYLPQAMLFKRLRLIAAS